MTPRAARSAAARTAPASSPRPEPAAARATPPPPDRTDPAALRRAEKYFRQGLLPEAIAEYARFVAANPRHWAALQVLGDLLVRAGRSPEAVEHYVRVAEHLHETDPGRSASICRKILALKGSVAHEGVRGRLVALSLERDDVDAAAAYAAGADEWRQVADALRARGREADALSALERVLDYDPADDATRLLVVRPLLDAGELERARARLAAVEAPELLLMRVELELTARDPAAARAAAARLLRGDATLADRVIALSCAAAQSSCDAAFACLDAATDVLAARRRWPDAARALEAYDAAVPGHVAALMKLVEICVDGDLAEPMRRSQVRLADAYLQAGRAREARVIAEDLAIENPGDPGNIARFRRALELLGEPDPDGFIAERLSEEGPAFGAPDEAEEEEQPPIPPASTSSPVPPAPRTVDMTAAGSSQPASRAGGETGAAEARTPRARGETGAGGSPVVLSAGDGARTAAATTLDAGEVPVRVGPGANPLAIAVRLHEAGRTDEAIDALRRAVRLREHRFASAQLLAKLHRERGEDEEAIEWFERARQEAPNAEAAHEVLYDLAVTLAAAGEADRAFAVFLELDVEAPGYRDVAGQIRRLKGRS